MSYFSLVTLIGRNIEYDMQLNINDNARDFLSALYRSYVEFYQYGAFANQARDDMDGFDLLFKLWMLDFENKKASSYWTLKSLTSSYIDNYVYMNRLFDRRIRMSTRIIDANDIKNSIQDFLQLTNIQISGKRLSTDDERKASTQLQSMIEQILISENDQPDMIDLIRQNVIGLNYSYNEEHEDENLKLVLSQQSIIQYSGLSDQDYVKGNIIGIILLESIRIQETQMSRELLEDIMNNWVLFVIRVSQIFNSLSVLNRDEVDMKDLYFIQGHESLRTDMEDKMIQMNKIDNPNDLIAQRQRILIRPQFGFARDIQYRFDRDLSNVLKNDDIQFNRFMIEYLQGPSLIAQVDKQGVKRIGNYLQGYGIDIISHCTIDRIVKYLDVVKGREQDDYGNMVVIYQIRFQVPKLKTNQVTELLGEQDDNDQQLVEQGDKTSAMKLSALEQARQKLDDLYETWVREDNDEFFLNESGQLLEFFTVNFSIKMTKTQYLKSQNKSERVKQQFLDEVKQTIRDKMSESLLYMLSNYDVPENAFKQLSIAMNLPNIIIRDMDIRVVLMYKNRNKLQVQAYAQRMIEDQNAIDAQYDFVQGKLRKNLEQDREDVRQIVNQAQEIQERFLLSRQLLDAINKAEEEEEKKQDEQQQQQEQQVQEEEIQLPQEVEEEESEDEPEYLKMLAIRSSKAMKKIQVESDEEEEIPMEVFKKKRNPRQFFSTREDKAQQRLDKIKRERNQGLRILEELKELNEIDDDQYFDIIHQYDLTDIETARELTRQLQLQRSSNQRQRQLQKKRQKKGYKCAQDKIFEFIMKPIDFGIDQDQLCEEITWSTMRKIDNLEEVYLWDVPVMNRIMYHACMNPKKYYIFDYGNQLIWQQWVEMQLNANKRQFILMIGKQHIYLTSYQQFRQIMSTDGDTIQQLASKRYIKNVDPTMSKKDFIENMLKKSSIRDSFKINKKKAANQLCVHTLKPSYRYNGISEALYLLQKSECYGMFDFETTFNDQAYAIANPNYSPEDYIDIREQVDFMAAYKVVVKIPFKQIEQALMRDCAIFTNRKLVDLQRLYKYENAVLDLDYEREYVIKGLPSASKLLQKMKEVRDMIDEHQKVFINAINKMRVALFDKCFGDLKRQKELQKKWNEMNFDSEENEIEENLDKFKNEAGKGRDIIGAQFDKPIKFINYAYNGSRFDFHFILAEIKRQHPNDWIDHLYYIGSISNMKIMEYYDIHFYDLQLMTAGGSLKSLCRDYDLPKELSKIDIDIRKFKTLTIVQENIEEIKKYVLNDVLCMEQIYLKMRNNISGMLYDVITKDVSFKWDSKELTCKQITNIFKYNISKENRLRELLKCQYRDWMTVSSLSFNIFKEYFNNNMLSGPTTMAQKRFAQSYYQGGLTCAFIKGYVDKPVYYLDFNSQYPSIMQNLKLPVNLNDFAMFKDEKRKITREMGLQEFGEFKKIIESKSKCYLNKDYGHYDLFKIQSFKYYDECNLRITHFGIKTKHNGTMYVFDYDYERDKDLQKDDLIVSGLTLCQAFNSGQLEYVEISARSGFRGVVTDAYRDFITYLYNERLEKKRKGNKSGALLDKITMNSGYGKLGQRDFPIKFRMRRGDYHNDQLLFQKMEEVLQNDLSIDVEMLHTKWSDIDISCERYGAKCENSDDEIVEITLNNVPRKPTGVGSMVYYAGLITDVARCWIRHIVNSVSDKGEVYYCDTDSVIVDQQAYNEITQNIRCFEIDGDKIGALKNEYPLNGDQNKTAVKNLYVVNKKIYQFTIVDDKGNEKVIRKFKGCSNPDEDFIEKMEINQKHAQQQVRFDCKDGVVKIKEQSLTYVDKITRQLGKMKNKYYCETLNYQNLQYYYYDYQDERQRVEYHNGEFRLKIDMVAWGETGYDQLSQISQFPEMDKDEAYFWDEVDKYFNGNN